MEKSNKVVLIGAAALAATLLYAMHKRDTLATAAITGSDNPFTTPYITDGAQPGQGFNSDINLSFGNSLLNGLGSYFPTFGFVAVGVTGSLPKTVVGVSVIQNNAPPQAVVQASAPTPAAGWSDTPAAPAVRPNGYYNMTGATPRGLTANLPGYQRSIGDH
jgi:hypothetical protein